MRILFIAPYVPSPIRSRSFNFLMQLARRGHAVTLAAVEGEPSEAAYRAEIAGWGVELMIERLGKGTIARNLAGALIGGVPLQSRYSWSPRLAARLRAVEADVVHIEHLRGARFGIDFLPGGAARRLPVVWDSVDSITHLFRQAAERSVSAASRLVSRFELKRTDRLEALLTTRFDHVIVTSALDRQALLDSVQRWPSGRSPAISVVPQGVDFERFHPFDLPVQADTIVFSGKMSYHANVAAIVHFAEHVMPLIWARRPQVRLQVVGKSPDRRVLALSADPRIEITGEVPELGPYIAAAAVAVAPIRYGAGMQNKVIESMACRTPVVATARAISAITARPDQDVLVAEAPEDFAAQVLRVLEDAGEREKFAAAGHQLVMQKYRWEEAVQRLEEAYHGAIQSIH